MNDSFILFNTLCLFLVELFREEGSNEKSSIPLATGLLPFLGVARAGEVGAANHNASLFTK